MKNQTSITIILDRSGSMFPIRNETVQSFNTFLDGQRELKGDVIFSLVQFNHEYEITYLDKNIKTAPSLTKETYSPSGFTALLDAMGRTVQELGKRLSILQEKDRPNKILVVLISDGEENKSSYCTFDQIEKMVTHQQEKYNWQFVFLGANMDAIKVSGTMGFVVGSSLHYTATGDGIGTAMDALGNYTRNYRTAANADEAKKTVFSQKDRDEQQI